MLRRGGRSGERYLRALLDACGEGILVLGSDGLVADATHAFLRLRGAAHADVVGRGLKDLVHGDDLAQAQALCAAAATHQGGSGPVRWRMRRGTGDSWIHVEVVAHNLLADPAVRGLLLSVRDVTQARSLEQRLKHDAFRDALTGLGNRVSLLDRVRIALARRSEEAHVAVLFLDLDDFKTVNDSLGHAAGDELLIGIAKNLRACLRPQDMAARLGGDEFAIVLEGITATEQAGEVATRIIEAFREPFTIGSTHIRVQTSVGVAVSGKGPQGAEELVRDADVAMYVAKDRGKGRFEYFDADMRAGAMARLEMRDALQGAIDRSDFVLHYQPVVDLNAGGVVGAEALLRWRDRQRGLVPPGRFVDLAEETGLMDTIGRWVLGQACWQAKRWQSTTGRDLRINVNLSPRQLDQPGLAAEIANILAETHLDPASLVVEITEQIFMQDSDHVLVNLQELKEVGVRLAIDDFGTGYSSLSYLQRFPVDYLKIDKSFVDDVGTDGTKPALARAVIEIAHSLELLVVAEGIERADQLRQLQEMGCDLGQGFLFAKPLDNHSMAKFLMLDQVPALDGLRSAEAPAAAALRLA
jgi:diguanylate cyclase (GGDEF)-like protein/PAS domain S-box-containing protein